MTNSRSIQRLEDDGRRQYPGITIYDVGDEAHATSISGHNHDDKPGVRAEDQDSDNKPEVRALDFMRGPKFSAAQAAALFEALTRRPANQARLLYVIYNRRIRSRSDGWKDRTYTGSNPHTDHVHVSGRAEDDENTQAWDIAPRSEDDMTAKDTDGIEAILTGSGSGTLAVPNNLHVKINAMMKELAALRVDVGAINDVDVEALAKALSAKLPEGLNLTKADVREALVDVLTRGVDAIIEEGDK